MPPDPLPSDCEGSMGTGDVIKEGVLVGLRHLVRLQGRRRVPALLLVPDAGAPGLGERAAAEQRAWERTARAFAASPDGQALGAKLRSYGAAARVPQRHG